MVLTTKFWKFVRTSQRSIMLSITYTCMGNLGKGRKYIVLILEIIHIINIHLKHLPTFVERQQTLAPHQFNRTTLDIENMKKASSLAHHSCTCISNGLNSHRPSLVDAVVKEQPQMVKDVHFKIIEEKSKTYPRKQAFIKGKGTSFILGAQPFILFQRKCLLARDITHLGKGMVQTYFIGKYENNVQRLMVHP